MRSLALALVALLAACGSTASNPDAGNGDDSGVASDVVEDANGTDAEVYPAPHTPMPQVDYNGGPVIANPEVVTISFAGDNTTLVNRFQQFDDVITTTPWWTAVSSEYCDSTNTCIGMGSGGGHVVVQDPPASSYTDSSTGGPSSIQDFIKLHVGNGSGGSDAGATAPDGGFIPDFPPADPNTIYVIYFPTGVTITLDGEPSCSSFGAYHNTTIVSDANGVPSTVAYAIIPRCDNTEATSTVAASHEITEASTDPDIGIGSVAFYLVSAPLWARAGGEVGDLCEGIGSNNTTTTQSTFTVQRIWSNKSAKAGNDPCVPIPSGEVYFNAAPRTATVMLPTIGSTAQITVDAYSTAPYPPWTINAVDFAAFEMGSSVLTFSFTSTSVQNGDSPVLTVTRTGNLPTGGDEFAIESKDAMGNRSSWFLGATQ
jgi:hypothetical protein